MVFCLKGQYQNAYNVFDSIKDKYVPAMYQLGVILYDDLLERVGLISSDFNWFKHLIFSMI